MILNIKKYKWNKNTAPNAFEIGSNILSLPLQPDSLQRSKNIY